MHAEGAMSPILAVGNADPELDHMIARVTLPAATRLPDRSSGDRAPQTPEKPRRQKSSAHLPHRKSEPHEDEHSNEELPAPERPAADDAQLYSPSHKAAASYSKDQVAHNVDIRA